MTEDTLSRRRLLAIAATTVMAGCSGQNDATDGTSNRFADAGKGSKPTPTAAATSTESDASVDIDIETRTKTERATREPRETERVETTTEEDRTPTGPEHVASARESLNESLAAFTTDENASVLDVDAAADFDPAAVRKKLSSVTAHLDSAENAPGVDDGTISTLRAARTAIDELVACQAAVTDAYSQFDRATTALYDEEFDTVRSALSKLDLFRSQAESTLRSFEEQTDASDFAPVDGVSEREYDVKIDQFSAAITGFEEVEPPTSDFKDGLTEFAEGVDGYVHGDYRGAEQDLLESLNDFEVASTTFLGVTVPESMQDQVDRLRGTTKGLANGTDHLIESCRAGKNGEEERRRSRYNDAMRAYRRSRGVSDLPSYTQLVDEA